MGILSPYLLNPYSEYIVRISNLDDIEAGVRIGGRFINDPRYADDPALLVESNEDLMKLLQTVKNKSEKSDLDLNRKKD